MRAFLIFILLSTLTACQKDKLEGDSSVLVGEWEWIYSEKYNYQNGDYIGTDTIYANTFPDVYGLQFEAKGYLRTTINYKKDQKYRIVFKTKNADFILIDLNNNENNGLVIDLIGDTMRTSSLHFPLAIKETGVNTYNYSHILVRQ